MLARLSVWVLAVALGQAPPEAGWLKAVPGDVDVVVRTRGLAASRDDLMAMLKATSPTLADNAAPALAAGIDQLKELIGEPGIGSPLIAVARLPRLNPGELPPFAVLVLKDDYQGVLKALAGGKDPGVQAEGGGVDTFASALDQRRWYAHKGSGFVAFGPDQGLVKEVAKPGEKTLDQILTPGLAKPFLAGDLGVYVNAAALATRYANEIDQARQGFLAALDQAPQAQAAGGAMDMRTVKEMYGKLFDGLKAADRLAFSFDFATEGFGLPAALSVKPDSSLARTIAAKRTGTADELAKLPADSAFYLYMNMDAETMDRLQGFSLRMLEAGGKEQPALQRAREKLRAIGPVEASSSTLFDKGMRGVHLIHAEDPKSYIAAALDMTRAMVEGIGNVKMFKELRIQENAEKHRGFTFHHQVAKVDLDAVAKAGAAQNPNANTAAVLKAMYGGDTMNTWVGTDGQRVVNLIAPTWNDAKAQLDAVLDGKSTIGAVPAFKTVRARLADRASFLGLFSAQGFVRMFATLSAARADQPAANPVLDLPKEPALFGVSLTPHPPALYEFHFVLPSQVGPVVEKGLLPLLQGLPKKPAP